MVNFSYAKKSYYGYSKIAFVILTENRVQFQYKHFHIPE